MKKTVETYTGSSWRSKYWDKIIIEKYFAEKMFAPLSVVRFSRNVGHVNNIPALCPLCSRLRFVIAVAFRRCSRDVASRAASLPLRYQSSTQ